VNWKISLSAGSYSETATPNVSNAKMVVFAQIMAWWLKVISYVSSRSPRQNG